MDKQIGHSSPEYNTAARSGPAGGETVAIVLLPSAACQITDSKKMLVAATRNGSRAQQELHATDVQPLGESTKTGHGSDWYYYRYSPVAFALRLVPVLCILCACTTHC